MNNITGIIVVVVIAIIIVICMSFINNSHIDESKLPKYHDIKHKFKTGDILLFGSIPKKSHIKKIHYILRSKLIGNSFSHVGIVMKFGTELYILETVSRNDYAMDKALYLNGNKNNRGGVRFIKLETLLSELNKAHINYHGIKYISEELDNNKILNILEKYKHKEFIYPYTLLNALFLIDSYIYSLPNNTKKVFGNNSTFCTQFVYDILSDVKVLKKGYPKLFWPYLFTDKYFSEFCNTKYSNSYDFAYI